VGFFWPVWPLLPPSFVYKAWVPSGYFRFALFFWPCFGFSPTEWLSRWLAAGEVGDQSFFFWGGLSPVVCGGDFGMSKALFPSRASLSRRAGALAPDARLLVSGSLLLPPLIAFPRGAGRTLLIKMFTALDSESALVEYGGR